jgi:hypothetical protein
MRVNGVKIKFDQIFFLAASASSLSLLICATIAWISSEGTFLFRLSDLMTTSSMLFSLSTTSRRVSTPKRMHWASVRPSLKFSSRNSRSSFDFLPIAFAFH